MKSFSCGSRITMMLAALTLVAMPAVALDQVIEHGSDIFQTLGDGNTFANFENNPLPADFFCTGSKPFAGRIVMKGKPIATLPEGALGPTDTIVQRLDSAVFDENDLAFTRIQLSAIQFESVQPFRNSCGQFKVEMGLDGEQPIGDMRIVRLTASAGYFEADVALNAKLTFTPVGREGETLEVTRHMQFPTSRNFWASRPGQGGIQYPGFVMVDTDANGEADTFVPGTSTNFAPGWMGNQEQGGILHREALSQRSGPEVSGSLKEARSGLLRVTPEMGLNQVSAGATTCSSSCHCYDDGNHCQIAVIEAETTTLE